MISVNEIKELIELFSSLNATENDDESAITISWKDKKEWEIDKKELEEICSNLNEKKLNETSLYSENSYEILLNPLNSRYFRVKPREEIITIEDDTNKIRYEISRASNHFMFFILNQLKEPKFSKNNYIKSRISFKLRRLFDNRNLRQQTLEKEDFLTLFNDSTGFLTLKINSHEKQNIDSYENLSTSFLFNLSYNLGLSIIETKTLDELSLPQRNYERKRNNLSEMNPPCRKYIADLVYYYQTARSSETASLKFLSYYHIIEYFFEKVYNDDLLTTVKDKLTSPDFSYKNNKEIKKLIQTIQKKTKIRSDTLTFDEKEALKLVLEKYVSLDKLKDSINDYDPDLIEHYKTKEVSFSRGNKIDFNSNKENILSNISSRIYKTRNSIVHSKEGDKPKYIPYKHEKQLLKEIILIEIITEDIIISSSNILFDS
jgi:hypothetical protein